MLFMQWQYLLILPNSLFFFINAQTHCSSYIKPSLGKPSVM